MYLLMDSQLFVCTFSILLKFQRLIIILEMKTKMIIIMFIVMYL